MGVSTLSPAAQIHWTNDGTTPTASAGNLINGSSGTIIVYADTVKTLKAVAFGNGYATSGMISALFDQQDHAPFAANPVFSPPNSSGAAPASNLTVTISTGSSGAQLLYTKDGSLPVISPRHGTWYNGTSTTTTVLANTAVTIKAIAYGPAYQDSGITSALFDRVDHTTTCVPPVFSPSGESGGAHPSVPLQVTLSTTTSGAKISYTTNNQVPTPTNGTIINGTSGTTYIGINADLYLKAIAFKTGNYDSPVTTGHYDNTDPGGGGNSATRKEGERAGQSAPDQVASVRTVDYTLDNCGNRTNVTDAGVSKPYVVNNLNQYSKVNGVTMGHGASHEMTNDGTSGYLYMGDSYLAQATSGNNVYTLYYDALGRCVKRTIVISGGAATASYYLFDGEHWIMEYDQTGANTSTVLYGRGIDEVIKRDVKVNGVMQAWHYFPDRNGNTSVVTDGANLVRESYRYDAFGAPTVTVPSGQSALNNRILFTGREWNATFGFYEYRARAYNPTIGRFMSEDPKGFDAGDYNLYRYVSNDPLDKTDPMGLDAQFTLIRDPYDSDANPRLSAGTMRITENSHFVAAIRVNENGFYPKRQGVPPGNYLVLPKRQDGESFKKGTPAVTSPERKSEPGATTAGHEEGMVLIHGEGPKGQPDSRACITCNPAGLKAVNEVFNRNKDSTTLDVHNGPKTQNGEPEIRKAIPIVLQKEGN